MDWIGASELLISWLSTRTSRCHACALLLAQRAPQVGEHEQRVRQARPGGTARGAAPRARPGRREAARRAVRGASPSSSSARPSASARLGRAAARRRPPAAARPARLTSRSAPALVEGEDRDVDLLHHLAEQRARLQRAQPLRRAACSPSALTSQAHLAQRVVRGRAPRPRRSSRPRAAPRAGWRASAAGRTTRSRSRATTAAEPANAPATSRPAQHLRAGVAAPEQHRGERQPRQPRQERASSEPSLEGDERPCRLRPAAACQVSSALSP